MKKKFPPQFLIIATSLLLIGCRNNTELEPNESIATNFEAEVITTESISEISKSTEIENMKVTESEDKTLENNNTNKETIENIKVTVDGKIYEITCGIENEYATLIRNEGYGIDKYKGVSITKTPEGIWIFVYIGNDTSARIWDCGLGEETILSEEEVNELIDEMFINTDAYIADCNNGNAIPIDLDGDGIITYSEADIISMMRSSNKITYKGTYTFSDSNDSGIILK